MEPDQLPRWGIPRAALPSEICDADLSAQDLTGQYSLVTCGQRTACATSKEGAEAVPLGALQLVIEQAAGDLSQGFVTIDGTGESVIDGRPFAATFERRKVKVAAEYSNLPAMCVEQWSLSFEYDFEGLEPRRLSFNQATTPDCEAQPGDYCKGGLSAEFGEATAE